MCSVVIEGSIGQERYGVEGSVHYIDVGGCYIRFRKMGVFEC